MTKPAADTPIKASNPIAAKLRHVMLAAEGSGGVVVDPVAGLNGTLPASYYTWVTDDAGDPALAFTSNAANLGIQYGDPAALDLPAPLTLVARVKPDGVNSLQVVAARYNAGAAGIHWILRYQDANRWVAYWGNSGNATQFLATPNTVVANVWQTWAMRFDPATGRATAFINGSEVAISPAGQTFSTIPAASVQYRVGAYQPGGQNFVGGISYAYLFNNALSNAEIASLHADPYQMFGSDGALLRRRRHAAKRSAA